jgi:hypothetical protein
MDGWIARFQADARERRAAPGRAARAGLLTEVELADDLARLEDPAVTIPSPVMWAAWAAAQVTHLPGV